MADGSGRREPTGARAFRALLALYPAAFRDEYGRELALVFVDRYRGAAGPWVRTRLWLEAAAGILAEAPREHLRVIRQDLAYAWRALRQHALVTATIVITLGLGIGANTAVFSLLNAVVLRSPIPVPDAGRLFTVNGGRHAASGPESARLSGPMFDALRESAPAGVTVAAMSRGVARVYTRAEGERETTPASLQLVSSGFLRVLGLSPSLGRDLPARVDAGDASLAFVSHGYWQRRLGGAPDVVGQALTVNGAAFTIAGVGPPGFSGVWLETPVDIWAPLAAQSAIQYSQSFSADGADLTRPWLPQAQVWWLHAVVRVPSGRPAAAAAAFNASLSARAGRDAGIVLEPFTRGLSQVRRQFSTPLRALLVMAALVLLVACANVANVLLARAVGRQREMAVRMAMGAGRSRLFHQLLTESALLVAMAGAVAVVFAGWAGRVLVRVATAATDGLPPFDAPLDLRVLGFAAGTAFLSVLLFGAWPAWRATRLDVVSALKSGARASMGGAGRPARVLVVAQVALSLVLVTATALFVRSFQHLLEVDPGVERERLLTLGIDPRLSGAPPGALPAMYGRVIDAVARVPGVESASLAMCSLQSTCATEDGYHIEGRQPRQDERVAFAVNVVTPGYFSTVGMRLVAGRALTDRDLEGTPTVAVVNRTLAARYFGEWPRALGRRVGLGTPDIEIVGIVEDARMLGDVKKDVPPGLFVPLAQRAVVPRVLEVRTLGDPAHAGDAVRRAVAGAAPELPVESAVTAEERLRRGLARDRLVILLTSGFGALALGLAGLGLFGVLSYAVARRVPELGLRLALGASPSNLRWSVVRDALRLVLTGVAVGLPFVLAGGTLVSSMVFGVSPRDAASVGAAAIVLLAVGVACSLLPAHRAARVDPVVALSEE
jgi:predicted permease